ncbi:hypothetical protein IW261DRAFT_1426488 [Armillaria novae-zelandiae]|uniref:Uncharacterized protein n=1 Tax=Armillaria novae-zelandiae TaxID=153914 RepID=A0AA39TZK5_9AGAR|nr:hypothetical protein IW261DRAFT_1426488 [Armillaria novae-zelandiae]
MPTCIAGGWAGGREQGVKDDEEARPKLVSECNGVAVLGKGRLGLAYRTMPTCIVGRWTAGSEGSKGEELIVVPKLVSKCNGVAVLSKCQLGLNRFSSKSQLAIAEHSHSVALGNQLWLGISQSAGALGPSGWCCYSDMKKKFCNVWTSMKLNMSINVNNALEDQGHFAKQVVEGCILDDFLMPKWLCHHDPEEECVLWPVEGVVCAPEDPFCYRLCSFLCSDVQQEMLNLNIIEHKPSWVYF